MTHFGTKYGKVLVASTIQVLYNKYHIWGHERW